MEKTRLLVVAMAEKCRTLILESETQDRELPIGLSRTHILWMCNTIEEHGDDGPATKLHRWIGFIQGAMLANRMVERDTLKTMFDEAKRAYGEAGEDLVDHLDPASSFELDIGGQG